MRELNKIERKNLQTGRSFSAPNFNSNELITLEECKEYLGKFNLSDQKILEMRNYLVGSVDQALNSYLENFK